MCGVANAGIRVALAGTYWEVQRDVMSQHTDLYEVATYIPSTRTEP